MKLLLVMFIIVISSIIWISMRRKKREAIDGFVGSDDPCSSIIALDFETKPQQSSPSNNNLINAARLLAGPTNPNSRLETVPTRYAPPPTTLPKTYTDWSLSDRPANIKMTSVQGGDFVALLYGPTASPPSNITAYVAYYDYVISTLYTSALGLKLSSPDLKVTAYLTDSGQVAPGDVKNAVAYGGSGWNVVYMSMPTSTDIDTHPESWQQTIGHELFHVFSTYADQTDMLTHGASESLANFFGWLSVSMYNGRKGAELISHSSFSCAAR